MVQYFFYLFFFSTHKWLHNYLVTKESIIYDLIWHSRSLDSLICFSIAINAFIFIITNDIGLSLTSSIEINKNKIFAKPRRFQQVRSLKLLSNFLVFKLLWSHLCIGKINKQKYVDTVCISNPSISGSSYTNKNFVKYETKMTILSPIFLGVNT